MLHAKQEMLLLPGEEDIVHTQEQPVGNDFDGLSHALKAEIVECEACGQSFKPIDGYYEPGEYAYCANCCTW